MWHAPRQPLPPPDVCADLTTPASGQALVLVHSGLRGPSVVKAVVPCQAACCAHANPLRHIPSICEDSQVSLSFRLCRYAMKTLEKSEMLERNKVGGLSWDAPGRCLTNKGLRTCRACCVTRNIKASVLQSAQRTSPGPQQSAGGGQCCFRVGCVLTETALLAAESGRE